MQNQSFGSFKGLHKSRTSKELMIILEDNCLKCLRHFDDEAKAPYCLFPCQHYFCKECVNATISNTNSCPQCAKEIASKNIRKSNLLLRLVRIIQSIEHKEPKNPQEMKEIERNVAMELLQENIFYQCNQCSFSFDRTIRQPILFCQNQHVVCTECIKNKSFKSCPFCKQTPLDEFIVCTLVLNACQFIQKILFSIRLRFIVNETSYNITTHDDTTLKDLFYKLQNEDCISSKINLQKCKFMVIPQGQDREEEVSDFDLKVGRLAHIELVYDEKDMISSSHILAPSKLYNQNAIKISNFKPISSLKYIVDEDNDDVFGELVQPEPSQLSNLYPQIDPNEVKPFKKEEFLNLPNNLLSHHQSALISQSRDRERYLIEEEEQKILIKKSKIMNLKEEPIGTECPANFIENYNTKLPLQKRSDVLKRFLGNHEASPGDLPLLCYAIEKVMNQPFTSSEIEQSQKMEEEIIKKAEGGDLQSKILTLLKAELISGEMKVLFTPKSTQRSQLTLKIITSHYLRDRFIVQEIIDEDERFFFEKCIGSEKAMTQFLDFTRQKYVQRFDFEPQNIVFHNVVKGSLKVIFSINEGAKFTKYIKNNLDKNLSIHPYFTQLQLSPEDFDKKGYIKFNETKKDIQFRGNWPYYQPIKSERFGIKVLGKFDKGNNVWLRMKNQPGEWAVGFHGVKHPNEAYNQYKNTIQSILAGLHRSDKHMLIDVQNSEQAHVNSSCINFPSQQIGRGVYLSPMFALCLLYAKPQKVGDKSYRLVFQCRLNPDSIRIPKQETKQNIWVVNNSAAIRPYGIVLIQNEIAMNYPSPIDQFGQNFHYAKYKERIEKNSPKKQSMKKSEASTE